VSQPEGGVLLDIGDADPEARAVAHCVTDFLVGLSDDDADLEDAGGCERLYPIKRMGLLATGTSCLAEV